MPDRVGSARSERWFVPWAHMSRPDAIPGRPEPAVPTSSAAHSTASMTFGAAGGGVWPGSGSCAAMAVEW